MCRTKYQNRDKNCSVGIAASHLVDNFNIHGVNIQTELRLHISIKMYKNWPIEGSFRVPQLETRTFKMSRCKFNKLCASTKASNRQSRERIHVSERVVGPASSRPALQIKFQCS